MKERTPEEEQKIDLQARQLFQEIAMQKAPVYIYDAPELFNLVINGPAFSIDTIYPVATSSAGAKVFRDKIESAAPVIMLQKWNSKKASVISDFLSKAGASVFCQDANIPFKVITTSNPEQIRAQLREEYENFYSTAGVKDAFTNEIIESKNSPAIRTHFNILDLCLDGGLYEGLYAIGAISSLGKTTFCLNIAEQIAANGQDVLIFSLEMSKNQLISRSISRLTFIKQANRPDKYRPEWAKTARGITAGSRYPDYCDNELDLITEATNYYFDNIAPHLFISEGIGKFTVESIERAITKHLEMTGRRPVVIVDYLQLIQHEDKYINGNDKIRTDFNLTELKRLSRDKKLPIIVISSFNRGGYNTEAKMESFKETGGIDYTCDVIIGLQLAGVGGASFDVTEAKAKNPREIELVFLKNRDAAVGDLIKYYYYPAFNHFVESTEDPRAEREEKKKAAEKAKERRAVETAMERAEMVAEAFNACQDNGTALITDMVDYLGGRPKANTLTKYINETGQYKVTGNKVKRLAE